MISTCIRRKLFSALIASLVLGPSMASAVDGDDLAFSGTLVCGGNHFNRLGGTEAWRSTYTIRNVNDSDNITINRIRTYNANGVVLYDSNVSGMPVFQNSVLGAGDNVIGPHQSAQLNTDEVVGSAGLSADDRPLQTVFEWSASKKVLTLGGGTTVWARARTQNPDTTWTYQEERSRHSGKCRTTHAVTRIR